MLPQAMWKILEWVVIFAEISYPIFIYNRYTYKSFLFIILSMHIGIAIFLNLYIFALIMIALNLGGFGYLKYNRNYDQNKELTLSI